MRLDVVMTTILRSIQRYQNWSEIIISLAKKQAPSKLILRNGTRFEVTDLYLSRNLVDEIFIKHIYTPLYLQIEANDVVVDIGAHIGVFTVFAASITQETVYAFEPSPSNFESLKRNIIVNGLNNVIPCGFAVSEKIGSAALVLSNKTSTSNTLSNHLIKVVLEQYIDVPTTTLPDIMDSNNIDQIGFLKMDCEGSEGVILESIPKGYLKRIKKIAIEFHDHLSKINHNDMRNLLEATGFTTNLKWDGKSSFGFLYGWRDCGLSQTSKAER